MIIEDKNKIKSVPSKCPEITAEDAEQYVIGLYNEINIKRDQLVNLRMHANTLEEEVKELEARFYKIKDLCNIEYCTKEVSEINNNMHLGIVTSDVGGRLH